MCTMKLHARLDNSSHLVNGVDFQTLQQANCTVETTKPLTPVVCQNVMLRVPWAAGPPQKGPQECIHCRLDTSYSPGRMGRRHSLKCRHMQSRRAKVGRKNTRAFHPPHQREASLGFPSHRSILVVNGLESLVKTLATQNKCKGLSSDICSSMGLHCSSKPSICLVQKSGLPEFKGYG